MSSQSGKRSVNDEKSPCGDSESIVKAKVFNKEDAAIDTQEYCDGAQSDKEADGAEQLRTASRDGDTHIDGEGASVVGPRYLVELVGLKRVVWRRRQKPDSQQLADS